MTNDNLKELKEEDVEKVYGGSTWINGIEYKHSWRDGWTNCPNCNCNGKTYFYTSENEPIYQCKTGVYTCGVCGNIWYI